MAASTINGRPVATVHWKGGLPARLYKYLGGQDARPPSTPSLQVGLSTAGLCKSPEVILIINNGKAIMPKKISPSAIEDIFFGDRRYTSFFEGKISV